MADDILFHKYDLRKIIDNQRAELRRELDGMQDSRLLNTDLAALQAYAIEKYEISLPVLGEPVVDESRAKMEVGRYGDYPGRGEPTVQVDAQRYTLEVPFDGDEELFFTQGSTYTYNRRQRRGSCCHVGRDARRQHADLPGQQTERAIWLADRPRAAGGTVDLRGDSSDPP